MRHARIVSERVGLCSEAIKMSFCDGLSHVNSGTALSDYRKDYVLVRHLQACYILILPRCIVHGCSHIFSTGGTNVVI